MKEVQPEFRDDGSINTDDSYNPTIIPDSILHHIDSVYLSHLFDIEHDNAIYSFVYESGYEILVVYTSDEAEELCENLNTEDDPFADSSSYSENPFNEDTFHEGTEQLAEFNPVQVNNDQLELDYPCEKPTLNLDEALNEDPFDEEAFYYYSYCDESFSEDSISEESLSDSAQ